MNNPAGFGGILLVLAAVAWLIVFVPGYASRSQLAARTSLVRKSQRAANKNIPLTPQQRLLRLGNTQRGFSFLFALSFLAAVSLAVAAFVGMIAWAFSPLLFTLATFFLVVSRAAARASANLAKSIYDNRERLRNSASRSASKQTSREWAPNPLPAPLSPAAPKPPEKLAQVIDISNSARSISSKELDEILARRRAI